MGLNRNLGQLTEALTESSGNVLLNPNNVVGGTNVYIGQQMASSDTWKIYGNTIANDRGEMVFELGDNAQPSTGVGQRFRFHYNETAGTQKSVLTLDYEESTLFGNFGVGTGSTVVNSGDLIGSLAFVSNDSSTNSSGAIGSIRSYATASYNTGSVSGDLRFYTQETGTPNGSLLSGAERMRIAFNGNVGVSTTPLWSLTNNVSLEIGSSQLLWSPTNGAANCGMSNNLYRNSTTWIHKNTGGGGLIAMEGGEIAFYLAGSDPAGSPSSTLGEKFRFFQNANLRIQSLGTGLVYSSSGTLTNSSPSDERLKEDITDFKYGLSEILQLRPVSYNWKNDKINQGKQFGFIAQEVKEIMPELISEFTTTDNEEEVVRLGLDKEGIYAALINAIKELKAEIEILKLNK
jgi:hypothetical protein